MFDLQSNITITKDEYDYLKQTEYEYKQLIYVMNKYLKDYKLGDKLKELCEMTNEINETENDDKWKN